MSPIRKIKKGTAILFLLVWIHIDLFAAVQHLSAAGTNTEGTAPLPAYSQPEEPAWLGEEIDKLFDQNLYSSCNLSNPVLIDIDLWQMREIEEIWIHGPSHYWMSVSGNVNGQWELLPGMTEVDLTLPEEGWASHGPATPIETDRLRLQLIPVETSGETLGLQEIEIWSANGYIPVGPEDARLGLLDPGIDHSQGRQYLSGQGHGIIGPEEGQYADHDSDNTFTLDLAFRPDQIERAFLAYELDGMDHWISPIRTINDQPAMGGYVIEKGKGKRQWEEISPACLKQGKNLIRFTPISDGEAYGISDVMILVQLHNRIAAVLRRAKQTEESGNLERVLAALQVQAGIHTNAQKADVDGNGRVELADAVAGLRAAADFAAASRDAEIDLPDSLRSPSPESLPSLTLTYPDAGQFYGDQVYLRGFVTPVDNGSGEADLYVKDHRISHIRGSFEAFVDAESADENGTLRLRAVYPDGETANLSFTLATDRFQENGEIEIHPGLDTDSDSEEATDDSDADDPSDPEEIPPDVNLIRNFNVDRSGEDQELAFAGAKLGISRGALQKARKLTMMTLRDRDLPALDTGMVNVTGKVKGYRFLPHGMKFNRKVKVKLPYAKHRIPDGFSAEDIHTYFFDEASGRWVRLPRETVDPAEETVISETDHFTDMINAVVQVPESPQAASFNPTQIKDIKVANPGAKVNQIQPPQANQRGDANLSYPLEVPPGRRGLQPQLAVQCSSGGGNGWMGLGWNLPVQAITIDTRWGVPRYDAAMETETYLFSGQQLTPLAHRDEFEDRVPDRTFHTRIEGGFNKIIRHGDHPADYWWEVIDKNGTHFYFGGAPDTHGPVEGATLTDPSGNIGYWALYRIEDSNGNTIDYRYTLQEDAGVGDGAVEGPTGEPRVPGYMLYPAEIFYTGHGGQPGPYQVSFLRDRDLGEDRRSDVAIDNRLGFKRVTADLLRRVEVRYQGGMIRGYEFSYSTGGFQKTLLRKIVQLDSAGEVFTSHEFSYYDEARDEQGNYLGFGPPETYQIGNDNIRVDGMIANSRASAMGGTRTSGRGGNIYIGYNPSSDSKGNSVGGKLGANRSTSQGLSAMVDVNGDGLPDKVFLDKVNGDAWRYRPNLTGPNGVLRFGDPIDFALNGISMDKSRMHSFGVENFLGSFVGINHSKTFSETTIYFSDVNGDGLVDQVRNGNVHFGFPAEDSPDMSRPIPDYSIDSTRTPSPIKAENGVDGNQLIADMEEIRNEMIDENPLHDTIRRWLAPYDGYIAIDGDMMLIEDTSEERAEYQTADGVRVAVQHNGDELWARTIDAEDYDPVTPEGLDSIRVKEGDRIYFRIQSRADGAYDQVLWDPRIVYPGKAPTVHFNGFDPYVYQASEDFIVTGRNSLVLTVPATGTVALNGDVEKLGPTSDDIRVRVLLNDTEVLNTPFGFDQTGAIPVNLSLPVNQEDRISLKIEADSPIDWTRIRWRPHLEYTDAVGVDELYDENGEPLVAFDPPYLADVYGDKESDGDGPHRPWIAPKTGVIRAETFISTVVPDDPPEEPSLITLTAKSVNTLLGKATYDVTDAPISETANGIKKRNFKIKTDLIPVTEGDPIFFSLSTRDRGLAQRLSSRNIEVQYQARDLFGEVSLDDDDPTWTADMNGTLTLYPDINTPADSGTMALRVRRNNALGGKLTFDVGESSEVFLTLPVETGDILRFELSTKDADLAELISGYRIFARMGSGREDDVPDALYYPAEENLFAQPFRGWGYAAYNGNRDRAERPIQEGDLVLPKEDASYDRNADVEDPEELDGEESPTKATAAVFFPEPAKDRWRGYDDGTWVTALGGSSSRLNVDNIQLPTSEDYAGAQAVSRLSRTEQLGLSGSLPIPPFEGSLSYTEGTNRCLLDYKDLNLDRHPDIVGENGIQFTLPTGGLEAESRPFSGGIQKNKTTSGNFGLSGNFPTTTYSGGGNEKQSGLQMKPLGFSGTYGKSKGSGSFNLIDINGDGLPDRIYQNGQVELNMGYGFESAEQWGNVEVNENHSESLSVGASMSFVKDHYGFGGGINLSDNFQHTNGAWMDINGDGLADYVRPDGNKLNVSLNTGGGFVAMTYPGGSLFSESVSTDQGRSLYFTIGIPLCYIPVKGPACYLIINPGEDSSKGISRPVVSIMDIDGDGYPDHLTSEEDGVITVRRNRIGRTNLLKSVTRPMGSSFTIEYERDGNTYQMPQSRWNMTRVEVFDGHEGDGVDKLVTTYTYEDGFYHRREREFFGYRVVRTEQRNGAEDDALYRSTTKTFYNRNYYEKGLPVSETVRDAAGNKYLETRNTYRLRDIDGGEILEGQFKERLTATVFPELTRTEKRFYEGRDEPGITTYQTFEYDQWGNIVHFFDGADAGAEDDVESLIEYHTDPANYIMGKAEKIVVQAGGSVMRRREAAFESGTGNLKQVRIHLGDGVAVHDMAYDQYGNIVRQTGPTNQNGQRYSLSYIYDGDVHTYVTRIEDSFGYVSSAEYDLLWGAVRRTVDINGQEMTYRYDNLGRVTGITGPYQQGTGRETLRFAYHPDATVPWALTQHFDNFGQKSDPIETVLFMDGLKRKIQTKKDGSVSSGNRNAQNLMIVSGRVIFDFAGRAVAQYYPVTESLGKQGKFNASFDGVQPTRTSHDVVDRPQATTLPDGTTISYEYGFGKDRDGRMRFRTEVTDANGNSKVSYKDVRELITSVQEFNGGKAIWTSYAYDPLRQIVTVKDNQNNITSVSYDLAGRRTQIDSPDMGMTEKVYDAASNVVKKITANLRAEGKAIEYDYTYSRLDAIRYPDYPENNVTYTYGGPGESENRAGRIISVSDGSGKEERFYGPLGETVKTVKYVASHTEGNSAGSPEIYVTEYEYDTYNRLRSLIYPDGEVLTYQYNTGGLPESVEGKKGEYDYLYMESLTYDKFEQRVYMKQGNGVETTYAYNSKNRRLKNLEARSKGKPFMDLSYGYDPVGNILSLGNAAAVKNANAIGGETQYTFAYDDLYRLTDSSGTFKQHKESHTFTLAMEYDDIHNIVSKNQQHDRVTPSGQRIEQKKTSYGYDYDYGSSRPHAPTHIGDRTFTYDANGNQTGWESDLNATRRKIHWDEENRIQKIEDNGHSMTYKYNDAGQRVFKTGPHGETVYVNQFYTVGNRERGSKHVFVGSSRIVTKLVKGQEDLTTTEADLEILDTASDTSGSSDPADEDVHPGNSDPSGNAWGHYKDNNPGGNSDPNSNSSSNNGGGAGNGSDSGMIVHEPDMFYYHPDHLGSTSYVTDSDGEIYQHLEYFPFGETWVEEVSNQYRVPYLFTAKELDRETGLYYFGARYYDPRVSVWVNCDPFDRFTPKSPTIGINLYQYTLWNPIRLIDPDGRLDYDTTNKQYTITRGDTLTSIGKRTGYSVDQLMGANPQIKNKNKIYAGDVINMPDAVPNAPEEANIDENIEITSKKTEVQITDYIPPFATNFVANKIEGLIWFYFQVKGEAGPGGPGPWDYKRQGKNGEYEAFGNYNYGAVGRAMGYPLDVLVLAAGVYQKMSNTSKPEWVVWNTFGDDPLDVGDIHRGYQYAEQLLAKDGTE